MTSIVYSVKYALTRGIEEIKGDIDLYSGNLNVIFPDGKISSLNYHEYVTTAQEAKKKAEILRLTEIDRLKKQIKKIKALRF